MPEPKGGDSLNPILLPQNDKEGGETTGEDKSVIIPPVESLKEEPSQKETSTDKQVKKAQEETHLQALSHIETMFSDKYSDEERKDFFVEHPELASVANKSKKFKEKYREMQEVVPIEEEVISKEEEIPSKEEETSSKEEEISSKENLDELAEKVLAKAAEKKLKQDRKIIAQGYAERNGLTEDEFKQFYSLAEASYSAADIEYENALKAALGLLGKSGNSTTNLPSGGVDVPVSDNKDKDSEVSKIMRRNSIDKELAEKLYNHSVANDKRGINYGVGESVEANFDFLNQ